MAGRLEDIVERAALQGGSFSFEQAVDVGLDRRTLRRSVTAGVLTRVSPQVYRFSGSPTSDRSSIWSAVLQIEDAAASHECAVRLHGLDRVPPVVVVSVPPGHARDHPGVRIHQANDLIPEHLHWIDGIPTTTIERAVIDVASVFLPAVLAHLVDELTIHRRLTTIGAIGRAFRQVDRRGRPHIGRLIPVLDARRPSDPAPRSKLERRVDEMLRTARVPCPDAEYPLPSTSHFPGYVDRGWSSTMLILEVDGRSWHAREAAMARDRARDREAAKVGWLTLRVLDDEINSCPDEARADIEATYEMRAAQFRRTG